MTEQVKTAAEAAEASVAAVVAVPTAVAASADSDLPAMGEVAECETAVMAAQISDWYSRAEGARGEFMRCAVAFGARLMAVELSILPRQNAKTNKANGNRYTGGREGLGAWLKANCPEIDYKTAMGYKAMAGKVCEMLGGATAESLAALRTPWKLNISYVAEGGELENVSGFVTERREAIFREATSRRALEAAYVRWLSSMEGEGGEKKPMPKLTKREAAVAVWAKVMATIGRQTVRDAIMFLPPKVAQTCLERLTELAKMAKKQTEIHD